MKTILKKLFQDLWRSKVKLLLSVIATAMASWGIVTVSFYFLLSERDFKTNYEGANPSDFTIVVANYNGRLLNEIEEDPSVSLVERRELLKGEILNKKGIWMPLLLFGLESLDYQKLDCISNVNQFNDGTIYIEKNASVFLEDVNKDMAIRLGKNKKPTHFEPAGLIHDPLQAPAQMEQVFYVYASLASLDSMITKNQVRLLVQIKKKARDYASVKRTADKIVSKLEGGGAQVLGLEIREPGKHVHQPIIDGVSFLQTSFGSVLLFLGIILFAMILLTWLVSQISDIGIMKSLGATRGKINNAYLVVILFIASIGLLIGFPSGLWTASKFNGFILMVQNFRPTYGHFPLYYYVLVALAALLPSLMIGLVPIKQISGAPVRQALTTIFYKEPGKIVKLLVRVGISARSKYSINNIFRNGFRTYLLLVLLCLGLSLYFTGAILSNSFKDELANYFEGTPYQVTVNLQETNPIDLDFMENLKEVKSVAPVLQSNISYRIKSKKHQAVLTMYPKDYRIKEGMFLNRSVNETCNDCIYIHPQMTQEDFKDVKIGEEIVLFINDSLERKVKYGGMLKDVFPGRKEMISWFMDAPLEKGNKLAIELKDGQQIENGMQVLETALEKKNMKFSSISNIKSSKTMLVNHFQPTYLIVQAMGIFTLVISLLGMLIIIGLTLKERVSEIGIIKALGGSASAISKLMVVEFLAITVLSIVIALPLAQVLSSALCRVYGEMIRGFGITQSVNFTLMLSFVFLLIITQSLTVLLFSNAKIKKSSLDLINNFD